MQQVIGHIFDSAQFTWHKESRTLVSEVSSTPEILRQLWADSMDLGFGIRSHKTGQVALFTLADRVVDNEGDTVKWVFEPSVRTVERMQGLRDVRVNVFNT